jgi:tetratricopeptide (TPR) repeat protein
MEHNRGNYDLAISYFRQSLEKHPDKDYTHYSLATSLAMKKKSHEAIQSLKRAIELNEDNRVYAKNDADFAAIQESQEFASLIGFHQTAAEESSKS